MKLEIQFWPNIPEIAPENPIKKFTYLEELSGHLLFQNCVYNYFDLGPPTP